MAPPSNIIELRNLLAQKFPGLKTSPALSRGTKPFWPTGCPRLDELLQGGLIKGAVTELVAPPAGSGGASLIRGLLRQSFQSGHWMVLIDGQDSFDPCAFDPALLQRLLWVRCRKADDVIKAADLALRDRNLPLVILDLALNPAAQLRPLSASVWYRFQRLIEGTSTICVAVTPWAMVSHAEARITITGRIGLASLLEPAETLWATLDLAKPDEPGQERRTTSA